MLPTITTDGTLALNENMTLDEWVAGLKFFRHAKSKLETWFSDYLKFGRENFGSETVDSCLVQLEFDMHSVSRAVQISSVPEDIRKDGLTSEHYVALAKSGLDRKGMSKWASVAAEQKLTPTRLKASIAAGEVLPESTAKQAIHGIVSPQGLRGGLDIWLRRVGGVDGILRMKPFVVQEIISELKAFSDLYNELVVATGASAQA